MNEKILNYEDFEKNTEKALKYCPFCNSRIEITETTNNVKNRKCPVCGWSDKILIIKDRSGKIIRAVILSSGFTEVKA